jgi:hypothetical protein
METEESILEAALKLIAEQRSTCLWFLRDDVLPSDRSRVVDLLRRIELHADQATFVKARKLRQWLSQNSSAASAGS